MSELQKEKSQRKEKKPLKAPSEASHGVRSKHSNCRTKESISNESSIDEYGFRHTHRKIVENTYQMGPTKRLPVSAVTDILKDVLTTNLQEETYEAEWSQKMTKTICETIRTRVKDLAIPRYKVVVLVHIGQLIGQGMQVSSRCLWDTATDNFASYSFKNTSLFAVATVYAVYFE